eukprot:jgi/Chrpa1/14808/Chrysochromulina_OHIO_Genome00005839-RA
MAQDMVSYEEGMPTDTEAKKKAVYASRLSRARSANWLKFGSSLGPRAAAASRDVDRLANSTNMALERNEFPCRVAASSFDGQLGVFATRDIAAGQRVLIERPLVLTPTPDARPFTECAALGAIAREELASQRPIVEPLAGNMVAQALRLLADRHAAVRVEALCGLTVAFADGATRLLSVPRSWPPAALVTQATDTALRFVPPEARVPVEELGDLLRRLQCNVFSVSSAVGTDDCDVGRAAFVGAMQFVNHSCAELTISYTNVYSDRAQRCSHLLENYGFECQCERCAPATAATEKTSAEQDDEVDDTWISILGAQFALLKADR